MQTIKIDNSNLPKHIAIILDGNRRWAKRNNLTVREGHTEGAKNLEEISKFCNEIGIKYLTVYAFSTENWKRSKEEVATLMLILKAYFNSFSRKGVTQNIKINIIGERDNLEPSLLKEIDRVMKKTKDCTGLTLNIAFNYGGRQEILHAIKNIAQKIKRNEIEIADINQEMVADNIYTKGIPDPDLLIRTSGEFRISNFLPWQLAYTEFYFPNKHWPEFKNEDLIKAIEEYQTRNRRFGQDQ